MKLRSLLLTFALLVWAVPAQSQVVDSLIIPLGASASGTLSASTLNFLVQQWRDTGRPVVMGILAPATLSGSSDTITVQIKVEGSAWTNLQSPPGTDIRVGAGKAIELLEFVFDSLRVVADSAQAAARTTYLIFR